MRKKRLRYDQQPDTPVCFGSVEVEESVNWSLFHVRQILFNTSGCNDSLNNSSLIVYKDHLKTNNGPFHWVSSLLEMDHTVASLGFMEPSEISLKNITSRSLAEETGDLPFGFIAMPWAYLGQVLWFWFGARKVETIYRECEIVEDERKSLKSD